MSIQETKKKPRLRTPRAAEILKHPSRFKALHGGRGGGKSWAIADHLIVKGYERPIRWLCCREVQNSLRESVHQLLVNRIHAMGLDSAFRATQNGIFGLNGTQFIFSGLRSNPERIKSMEGLDGAWVEEAEKCSQRSLDLLIPTVRKEGSEIWFSWNRVKTTDPVDAMFFAGELPPRTLIAQMNWNHNPFLSPELREAMEFEKRRNPAKWLNVWEGNPLLRSDAQVFTNWGVRDLDDDVTGLHPRFGADWGMRDPTVLVKVYRKDRILYIADEVYKVGATIDERPALFAGTWRSGYKGRERWTNKWGHRGLPDVLRYPIIADNAPEMIQYMRARGFDMQGALKGPKSVEEGVEFMQSFDIVVNPRCKNCIDELNNYSYKICPDTDRVLPELEDKDNHVIDCDSLRCGGGAAAACQARESAGGWHSGSLLMSK